MALFNLYFKPHVCGNRLQARGRAPVAAAIYVAASTMLKTLRLTIIFAMLLPVLVVTATIALAFFPDISGLPEGLSEEQFRRQYGSTQSENYRKQVALIDQRIARLPVY